MLHVGPLPVQSVCGLHASVLGLHTVLDPWKLSDGQLAELPGQYSMRSQGPALPRQTVPEDLKESLGHAAIFPSQVSAISQPPLVAGLHT
jgi:hypothetical protein